jgi:hypothetical protein
MGGYVRKKSVFVLSDMVNLRSQTVKFHRV